MTEKKKIALAIVITAIVSILLTVGAIFVYEAVSFVRNGGGLAGKIGLVQTIIDSEYLYDDYDKNTLEEAAVKGYVAGLDEPYTEYFTADEFRSYTDALSDGYVGIGIIVSVNDKNEIEIVAPFEDSPAYEAGVLPGDILKGVNGKSYTGSELNDAIKVIRGGKEGTSVDIVIGRDGTDVDLTVERREITEDSVKSEMLDDGVGYIRITQFNEPSEQSKKSTLTEFKDALSSLKADGMTSLIIDLRDNPGGILEEVCGVADLLLPEGIITYTEDKNGKRETYNSDADCLGIPMAVLINGNSASASEVLTGALKDYGVATVVGEKSFGKGIVQDVVMFLDGSGLSFTCAKYYTPSGVCIHDIGIEPDVKVETPEEYKNTYASMIEHDKDIQLKKAIEAVKEK